MLASPDCSPMRSSRPSSLSACSRTSSGIPASSILARYSSTMLRAVLAQLALDRLHLLAQEVLALLLVGAGLDVLADAPADLQLGQAVALDADRERQALGDVDGLEDLDLLLEGDVGRVADRVGQRAGLGDRAQERADALVGAAQPRGSPRRWRGTHARARGCARPPGRCRVPPRPRRAGGRAHRCRRRRRCRASRRRGTRRVRRRAAARVRRHERSSRPWRTRRHDAGRAARARRRPTSTGSVTSMVGNTTVSSRGMSRSCVMQACPSIATYE